MKIHSNLIQLTRDRPRHVLKSDERDHAPCRWGATMSRKKRRATRRVIAADGTVNEENWNAREVPARANELQTRAFHGGGTWKTCLNESRRLVWMKMNSRLLKLTNLNNFGKLCITRLIKVRSHRNAHRSMALKLLHPKSFGCNSIGSTCAPQISFQSSRSSVDGLLLRLDLRTNATSDRVAPKSKRADRVEIHRLRQIPPTPLLCLRCKPHANERDLVSQTKNVKT